MRAILLQPGGDLKSNFFLPRCTSAAGRGCAARGGDLWRTGLALDWVREVRELVFALDADAAGQQQWRALARPGASASSASTGLAACRRCFRTVR